MILGNLLLRYCRHIVSSVMRRNLFAGFAGVAVLLCPVIAPASKKLAEKPSAQDPEIVWTSRIEPLLDKQCLKCHAGVRQQGGLDLRSLDTMLRGRKPRPSHPARQNPTTADWCNL